MELQNVENATENTVTERQVQNEGEDDDYIDDEEMIKIAESWLIRISDELKNKNLDIKQLFEENIMVENIGDQSIELLAPIHFIEGLKKLGIQDFTELEIAWLVNLLTRPELDDLILLEELNILRDNSKIRESVTDFLEKTPDSTDNIAHEASNTDVDASNEK